MYSMGERIAQVMQFLGGTGDVHVDGWRAAQSPGLVAVLDGDQMESLKAGGIGVWVTSGFRILAASGEVLKDVDLSRPVH